MFSFCMAWRKSCIECFFTILDSCNIIWKLVGRLFSLQVPWYKRIFERTFLLRVIRINGEAFDTMARWGFTWMRLWGGEVLMIMRLLVVLGFWMIFIVFVTNLNIFLDSLQHISSKLKQFLSFVLFGIDPNRWWMIC